MRKLLTIAALTVLTGSVTLAALNADEGMWLFNNPPRELLKKKYNFDPTAEWLEHVQKSSVRFNSGGSGSFVSPNGLVMTNHHVGADTLQKISKKGKDYLKEGFHAKTLAEEVPAVDLELNVLMRIDDVTKEVKSAVTDKMSPTEAFEARRAKIAQIEAENQKKTGLRSNVITLYKGGQYHLYSFKRYTDVRLVFAPEQQIAFFGGDPDNFEYPRYDLDVCFFRVYENGKPAKVEHYLTWSENGATDGELVFVSGHPGNTERFDTLAELKYLRDKGLPFWLDRLYRREVLLTLYSARDAENARKAKDTLFGVQNSRKAIEGELGGLLDPALMAKKAEEEKKLIKAVEEKTELRPYASAWQRIAYAQKVRRDNIVKYTMIEAGQGLWSNLFGVARTLVRAAEELPKPNEKRMSGYNDSDLEPLKLRLFSKAPIYDDFEIIKLADSLTWMCAEMGEANKTVQKILDGKSPRERAAELVTGSTLKDVAERKRLFEGGQKAIEASKDPMILLARSIDKESRALREVMETQVEEVRRQAYDQIAQAKFAIEGTSVYPDATFTLRLAFGTVKGYEENAKHVTFETTFSGLYERAALAKSRPPFDLPPLWEKRKSNLNLKTPLNFVCTADIIGGNSGSPVINRKAEVVGLIFDGNIQSLVWDFIYTDVQARAVAVHSRGIIEALRNVYDANELASEIVGKSRK
jgi:hypothetical protein